MNTKAKGSAIERAFKKYFTNHGYLMTKAGGSFGIDLVGIKRNHLPILVNVKAKRNYCGPEERKQLIEDARVYGGVSILAYKVIFKGKKLSRYCIEILTSHERKGDYLVLDTRWSSTVDLVSLEQLLLHFCIPPKK